MMIDIAYETMIVLSSLPFPVSLSMRYQLSSLMEVRNKTNGICNKEK